MLTVILSAAKNLLFQGRWVLPLDSSSLRRFAPSVGVLRVVVFAGLVVGGVFALTCHRDAPAPLPARVAARVERQRVESAVDSTAITHLEKAAIVDEVQTDTAVTRAVRAADSSDYREAYTLEDSAVVSLDKQVAVLDVALTKSESRATQADSVIAAVLPIAESRQPPCRILWFVPCPTRRAVAVAAAGVTAVAFILIPRTVHP